MCFFAVKSAQTAKCFFPPFDYSMIIRRSGSASQIPRTAHYNPFHETEKDSLSIPEVVECCGELPF